MFVFIVIGFVDGFVYKGKENTIKDREERLRLVREKHDEERQRKLEELKQQVIRLAVDLIHFYTNVFISFYDFTSLFRHWLFKGIENKKKKKGEDA